MFRHTHLVIGLITITALLASTADATAFSFGEDFSTTALRDPVVTTALWDTLAQQVTLPPFANELLGSYDTPGSCVDVVVSGATAIIADHTAGIILMDVSDPANPIYVGNMDTPGIARAVAVDGHYCFVADDTNGLVIYEFTRSAGLDYLATVDTPGHAYDVTIAGNRAYVADDTGGLQVVDISDPALPAIIGSTSSGVIMRGVKVQGDYAYIANYTAGLTVADISDPASPFVVATYPTTSARGIDVAGDLALVADYANGLVIFDIKDPASPVLRGHYVTPGLALGVKVQGNQAYVADYAQGLQILDIGDPANPALVSSFPTPSYAYTVDIQGGIAYMADWSAGLQIIKVADPAGLYEVGGATFAGSASGVTVDGQHAFVSQGNQMNILDIADPSQPVTVGSVFLPDIAAKGAISGNVMYLLTNEGYLNVLDITDPTNPALAYTEWGAFGRDIAIDGDCAFLASENDLKSYDLSDPLNPTLISNLASGMDNPSAIALLDQYALVASELHGIGVYNIQDPQAMTLVANPITTPCVDIKRYGQFCLLATQNSGQILIYDFQSPTTPTLVGTFGLDLPPQDIEIAGNLAFIACGGQGNGSLVALDITDPASLQLLYEVPTNGGPDLALGGDTAFLADAGNGLRDYTILQSDYDASRNLVQSLPVFHAEKTVAQVTLYAFGTGANTWGVGDSPSGSWTPMSGVSSAWVNYPAGSDMRWRGELFPAQDGTAPACTHITLWFAYAEPGIMSVTDIPNDQGRQVRLQWEKSAYDDVGNPPFSVIGYYIYRALPSKNGEPVSPLKGDKAAGWDYLGTVPPTTDGSYSVVVPTLGDSTITGGVFLSTFQVRAMCNISGVYFDSDPVAGYSVDNLSPSVPGSFTVTYGAGVNDLTWDESPDADFRYFRVYRGTNPDFIPGPATVVHECVTPAWTDGSEPGVCFYKVTALDFSGNESQPAHFEGMSGSPDLPVAFALHANVPNPFNPSTTIAFDLPHASRVTLEIYDLSGRRVASLVNDTMAAGAHSAVWRGKNQDGSAVGSGIYFARLTADDFVKTMKMTLIQ